MKGKLFAIFVFIFLIIHYNLFSSESIYLNNYTDLKLGEKIQISNDQKNNDFHCFIFLDVISCSLCQQSLINITEIISTKHKINITLFIGGCNKKSIYKITKEYPQNWTIIDDNIGAFKNFYKIKTYPFYFITNNEGEILAMDKAGGNLINEINLDTILSFNEIKLSENSNILKMQRSNLILLNTIKIENEEDWIFGKLRYILYSKSSNSFYLLIPKTYSIFKIDTNGLIIKKWKIPIKNTISFYSPNWIIQDTSIFLVNNSYNAYREYLYFNLIDQNIINFNINKHLYDSLKLNLHWVNYYSPDLNTFFSSLKPYDNSKLEKNFKNLILCNLDKNNLIRFGKINIKFQQYKLSDLYYSVFYYDKDKDLLLEIENLTDQLNFYDIKNQKLTKTIKVIFNEYYKNINKDYNTELSIDKKIDLYNGIPYYDKIFKIGISKYALFYFYIKRKNNDIDKWSWDYYIHFLNTDLNKNKDVQIPINEIPFYIDEYFIYTSKFEDENIYIKKYQHQLNF
jgi:hypothetical protein